MDDKQCAECPVCPSEALRELTGTIERYHGEVTTAMATGTARMDQHSTDIKEIRTTQESIVKQLAPYSWTRRAAMAAIGMIIGIVSWIGFAEIKGWLK